MNLEISSLTLKSWLTRHRSSLVPLATAVVALTVIGLILAPQLLGFLTTNQEIAGAQDQASKLEVKATQLESLDTDSFSQNLGVVKTLLPQDPDIPLALGYLQGLVQRANLTTDSISYLPADDGSSSFQLNLSVTGDLSQIRNLLISLQGAPRVFQVQTITTTKSERGIQATIPISVYYGEISPGELSGEEPVTPLTESEVGLLQQLSTLVPKGSVGVAETPSASRVPVGKIDPFE